MTRSTPTKPPMMSRHGKTSDLSLGGEQITKYSYARKREPTSLSESVNRRAVRLAELTAQCRNDDDQAEPDLALTG